MPLISSLALAPVLLKTGGATLATGGTSTSLATGTTAAVGGGAAAAGGKLLGISMLVKGLPSAAKSGAFTKFGACASATHAAIAPAASTAAGTSVTPVAAAAPAVGPAPALSAAPAPAATAATGGGAMPAPAAGHGNHFTMMATVIGIMVLRAVANRYWLAKPVPNKNRLVRRVSRWSKEEEVAVEAEDEFGQIPQLPFKEESRSYVEAGTGAPAPTRGEGAESRVSATRGTDAGLTDMETTASTQETRRRRVSYVRRAKGKLHRFL